MAWRLASSSNWVYSVISPPPSERRPAMMLPPNPRLRTTTPKTCPFVSTMRKCVIPSVVTTIMITSIHWRIFDLDVIICLHGAECNGKRQQYFGIFICMYYNGHEPPHLTTV